MPRYWYRFSGIFNNYDNNIAFWILIPSRTLKKHKNNKKQIEMKSISIIMLFISESIHWSGRVNLQNKRFKLNILEELEINRLDSSTYFGKTSHSNEFYDNKLFRSFTWGIPFIFRNFITVLHQATWK